ncbi:MAG: hypothetical protein Q9162_005146 [Coniocarpon cinnabarinum]
MTPILRKLRLLKSESGAYSGGHQYHSDYSSAAKQVSGNSVRHSKRLALTSTNRTNSNDSSRNGLHPSGGYGFSAEGAVSQASSDEDFITEQRAANGIHGHGDVYALTTIDVQTQRK